MVIITLKQVSRDIESGGDQLLVRWGSDLLHSSVLGLVTQGLEANSEHICLTLMEKYTEIYLK